MGTEEDDCSYRGSFVKLLEASRQGNAVGDRACGSLPLVSPGLQGHHHLQQMRSQHTATRLDKQLPSRISKSSERFSSV